MSLSILEFYAGDTTYIAKHNQNYAAIKAAIESLQAAVLGGSSGSTAAGGLQEIFDRNGLIGVDSYVVTPNSPADKKVNVSAGAFFSFSTLAYLKKTSVTELDFTTLSAGTFYVSLDSLGNPIISAGLTTYAIYTVVWDGSSVESADITRYAPILLDGTDYAACIDGGPLTGGPYTSLSARLDNIENNLGGAGTGTTSLEWKLRQGFTGTPGSGDIYALTCERGTAADVSIRYNENAAKWQFTNDGTTWNDLVTSASGSATGTNEVSWTVDEDNSGAVAETSIRFEGGTSDDVIIRATTGRKLEWSEDGGVTWHQFVGADGFNIGGGETNRVYYKESDVSAVSEVNLSDSTDWSEVDLTSSLTEAGTGEQAVAAILRVYYSDSAPAADTRVRFRKGGSVESPDGVAAVYAYTTGSKPDPSIIHVPLSTSNKFEYYVEASGTETAVLTVVLVGYVVEKTGIGTQKQTVTHSGLTVSAGSNQVFDEVGWLNRGLVWYTSISQGGMTAGTYTLEFYAEAACTTLLFKAASIAFDASYTDSLPWFYEDAGEDATLHVKITNNGTGTGSFTVTLKAERFA